VARSAAQVFEAGEPVDFDAIEPAPGHVQVTEAELDALEKEYGALPPRYREFMGRFGAGDYRGVLGVLGPAQVRATTEARRTFFKDNLLLFKGTVRLRTLKTTLWQNANDVLSPDDVTRLVVLAQATGGDLATLAFVSGEAGRLLRFQRPGRKTRIEQVGPTFAHAIAKYFEDEEEDEDN
jgi:hypothetical protein